MSDEMDETDGATVTNSGEVEADRLYTRREWLTRYAIMTGASPMLAKEAVASTAIEHPEWDMDGETKTMADWEIMEGHA
jgi:hypothetical protein